MTEKAVPMAVEDTPAATIDRLIPSGCVDKRVASRPASRSTTRAKLVMARSRHY